MKTSIVLEFTSVPLFKDEMVLVASKNHPTINGWVMNTNVENQEHGGGFAGFVRVYCS